MTNFKTFMQEVDACIAAKAFGLTSDDLPDIAYRDLFEAGETAEAAATEALEYAEFPFDAIGGD